jgi:hypothetical protein
MAVGFLCRDGVVIGADRQVTGANYTFPECKLTNPRWKNGDGILAYSGDRDTFLNFADEIGVRIPHDGEFNDQALNRILKECLGALALKEDESFFTLFGYWLDGKGKQPSLLMSHSSGLNTRIVGVPQCEVIGYADSPLTRFLLGRLRDLQLGYWTTSQVGITTGQAMVYATYFISLAKKYDGQFVGDGIDLYSISRSSDSGPRCIFFLDSPRSSEREEEINFFQYNMDLLFHRLSGSGSDLDVAMKEFSKGVKRFTKLIRGE